MKNCFFIILLFWALCNTSILPQYNASVLEGTHNNAYTVVEPPSIYKYRTVLGKIATSNFEISYTDPMPPGQARTAIEYAIKIWEFLINSDQTINILINWKDLGYSSTGVYTLANCGPTTYYNSPSLPKENVQYPIALAEHLMNQNLNEDDDYEMIININSNDSVSWYFGTDGVPQKDKVDMVSVILHETAHGLGYIDFFNVSGSYGYKGKSGFPVDTNSHSSIYDIYTSLNSYYPALDFLVSYPNHSTELKTKLTSDNVYFSGDNAWIQNGRYRLPKLYAPAGWKAGSSISHLDEATFPQGNSNSLMTPQFDQAEVIHSPGEVGLAILKDLGWNINRLATFIHPEPGVSLQKGAVDTIKWIDNEGGSYNLDLLDSYDNFIMTVCTLGMANDGLNQYVWTVPANVPDGMYRIKIQFGGAFGGTNLFSISEQQQVAKPIFTPPPDTYENPVTVTSYCPTSGATIRYTINGTEPTINSPVFPPSLEITTLTTIKAKAFKTGMIPSLTTTAVYNIGIEITVPELFPISGTYPQGLKTTLSWESGLRCFMNYTNDGSEPYDPSIPGYQVEISPNPKTYTWENIGTIKMKARTYLNGTWSSLVEREYIIIPGVAIKQLDASGTPFGQAAYWDYSFWNYIEPDQPVAMENTKKYFLSSHNWKPGTNQKFNYWDDNLNNKRYRNWDTLSIKSGTREVISHFSEAVNGVTIKNSLESTGINVGQVEFMDPWLVDFNEPPYGIRSQGMNAPFLPRPSPFNPNYSSSYKGVFLNQGYDPVYHTWKPPYYKVGMPDEQIISVNGQNRKFYPVGWGGSGVTIQSPGAVTGIVFNSPNAVAIATLKGQLMSNSTTGISSNSQRKMVRTDNGIYHLVYESMGNVYYTHSLTSNLDGSWSQEELLMTNAKNPAIEYHVNNVKIVLEFYDPVYGPDAIIYLATYAPNASGVYTQVANECEEVANFPVSYFGNAKPVISYNQVQLFIAYRKNSTEGLKERTKWFNINTGLWNWSSEAAIPGTNLYSINPSVVESYAHIHLVYESQNSIMYKYAVTESYAGPWQYEAAINVSTGSGFTKNNYPNISISNGLQTYLLVSWLGAYNNTQSKIIAKENDYGLKREAVVVKAGYNNSWGGSTNFSNNVNFTNNNSINSSAGSIITWSESNGLYSKFVKRNSNGNYSTIANLSTSGIQTMVSNGSSFDNIKVMVFNTSTPAPYLLNKCTNNFVQGGLSKIGETEIADISYGRAGVVEKNGMEFLFNIGDVSLNGQTIQFIERIDTLPVNSLEELNEFARTESFNLNSQSELIFSNYYYVVNPSLADSVLTDIFYVNFKCELVNSATNQVIGTFDNITYNKSNVDEYNNTGYLVDCSGIESGDYFLRLFTTVSKDVNLFISDFQRDDINLEKSNLIKRNFKGEGLPTTYELAQNYPNPFNPSTTIKYQLPKDGIVTLKVYDILGSEVATLVNEQKTAGRYEVSFNASQLASGVYIYRLQSGEYISSRKMMLLK